MPLVSVVMTSYNHARFLTQAIRSVLEQSVVDLELIIIENGSADNSLDVIASFTDTRLHLHTLTENIGATAALNLAISHATGELVALLNSDDYFLPGKLQRQLEAFTQRPDVGAVFGNCMIVDEQGLPHPLHQNATWFHTHCTTRYEYLRHFFFANNCVCHPTVMVRRSVIDTVGPFDYRLRRMPDLDYWIRIATNYEIANLDDRISAYRLMDDGSNESGPRPEVRAASAWEFAHVLDHYTHLDAQTFASVFSQEIEAMQLQGLTRKVQLGRIAVAASHASAHAFGMRLLYEALTDKHPGISAKELQNLSSVLDIYGITARSQIPVLESTSTQLRHELLDTRKELDAIIHSKSYRYTAPMRAVLSTFSQAGRTAQKLF